MLGFVPERDKTSVRWALPHRIVVLINVFVFRPEEERKTVSREILDDWQ